MPLLALLALQTAWKPYTLSGFAMSLPSPPVDQKVPGQAPGTRIWLSMHNGRNAIAVSVATLPPSPTGRPDQALAGMVGGTVRAAGAKLVSEADALLAGWPAIDFRYRTPDGIVGFARAAVVGDQLIELSVSSDSEKAAKPAYDRFLANLRVPKAGTLTQAGPTFVRRKLMDSPASTEMPGTPTERSAALNEKPGALVLHTQECPFANRLYSASYGDVPPEQMPKEEQAADALQAINDDVVRSLKGQGAKSSNSTLDRFPAVRTVCDLGPNGAAIIVSSFHENRIYTLLAVVPAPWKEGAEPKRFFDSFRAGPTG